MHIFLSLKGTTVAHRSIKSENPKSDYVIQLIHHHVTFNFNPGDACKRCLFCVHASTLSATMAGPSKCES